MSLLDKGPHEVIVLNRESFRNERKQKEWRNVGPPHYVRCGVQPVREWSTSEESFSDGIQMLDLRRMFTRRWPGDIDSHAIYLGDLYESVGAPQFQQMSRRTRHFAVTLRYIGRVQRPDIEYCADQLALTYSEATSDTDLLDAVLAAARAIWQAAKE